MMQCPKCGSENPVKTHTCICCDNTLIAVASFQGEGAGFAGDDPSTSHIPPPEVLREYAPQSQYAHVGENTSGMGQGYATHPDAAGWSFAGFVPFGIFALYNGLLTWGIVGLLLTPFFPLYLVYGVVIGIIGKKQAWCSRRFADASEYNRTMHVWNAAGVVLGIMVIVMFFYWTVMLAQIMTLGAVGYPDGACAPSG